MNYKNLIERLNNAAGGPEGRKMCQDAAKAITDLLIRAEKAERERDAAIKELNRVAAAVDELSDMIDSEVHPVVDYNLYLSLRENFDAISIWEHESEWHGLKEE